MRIVFLFVVFLGLSVPPVQGSEVSARREKIREWVISRASLVHPAISPAGNDLAGDLVDKLSVTNLAEMDRRNLKKSELPESPWTDSYWPTYAGQIANRYADPDFNAALIWKSNYDYLWQNIGRGDTMKLSPAEKYDLLVGDDSFTLTKKMISSGEPYADANGSVETWFGLCHGWAPASFMFPRPARSVSVTAADGRELVFTPSDLKALATALWANGGGQTRFIGGRCDEKKMGRDNDGRETNPYCFDTNPATWHLSVVNQIGVSRRSFVMDISSDYEVWNQPIFGYSYDYVNPNTKKWARSLADAKVKMADLKNDPFRRFRSPQAVSLVTVSMAVSYVTETDPSTRATDGPENDHHQLAHFAYDLELDEKDNIVGGEWQTANHPDFLWLPVQKARAVSRGDVWLEHSGDESRWVGQGALPAAWKEAAKIASAREQPLAKVVESLFELARQ